MNDFLIVSGLAESVGRTYVGVANPEDQEIIAYVTLCPDPIELRENSELYENTTILRLERLAVDQKYQRQGVGKWMLIKVIEHILLLERTTSYKVDALELQALNQQAETYYKHLDFGFIDISPGRGRLVLLIETMRQLVP